MPMLSDPVNSSLDARDDAMNLAIYGPLAIGPRATNIAMKRAIKMQLSSEQNETTVLEMLPHLKTWIICATNISYLLPRIYDLPNMFSFVQYFISPSQDLWSSYEIYFQIASCRAFSLSSTANRSFMQNIDTPTFARNTLILQRGVKGAISLKTIYAAHFPLHKNYDMTPSVPTSQEALV